MDKETDELATKPIHELCKMSINDLEGYREEVMEDLAAFKRPEWTIAFINALVDLIIEKKHEKARTTV